MKTVGLLFSEEQAEKSASPKTENTEPKKEKKATKE